MRNLLKLDVNELRIRNQEIGNEVIELFGGDSVVI